MSLVKSVIFVGLMLVFWNNGQTQYDPAANLIKGLEMAQKGEFNKATETFSKLLKKDQFNEYINVYLAVIKDVKDAKLNQKTAVEFFEGITYLVKKQYQSAINSFTNAITIEQNYAGFYSNRGDAYLQLAQYPLAEKDFKKTIELQPNHANAYYNLGITSLFTNNTNNIQSSIQSFSKAIKFNPKFLKAYNYRGQLYEKQKMYELATKDYKKIIELDKNFTDVYNNLGNISSIKGHNLAAFTYYSKAIELDANNTLYHYNRGIVLFNMKKYDKAIIDFSNAIKINPKNINAYYNRALAYRFINQNDMAINDFNKVISLSPKDGDAYDNRGTTYFSNIGDKVRGCADYAKACELGYCRNYNITVRDRLCE